MAITSTCAETQETNFDIVQIIPFFVGKIKHAVPFNVIQPTVSAADLGVDSISILIKGISRFAISEQFDEAGSLISHDMEAATVDSSNEASVAGDTHKVVLTFKAIGAGAASVRAVHALRVCPCEFIVVGDANRYAFIRCPDMGYKCTVKDTGDVRTVSIEINNINGLQYIME